MDGVLPARTEIRVWHLLLTAAKSTFVSPFHRLIDLIIGGD
jgi:hypothetical protein